MANSTKTPPKSGTLTQFPTPEAAVAVADPPEETPEEIEAAIPAAFQPPAAKKMGRPRKGDPPVESDFFRRVADVPAEDWGTRVYLYLYQLEPVCNLKQSGGKSYLMRYQEPILDEHRIMIEQGSGSYRFMLAKNKTGPEAGNALAQYEFEIYNPQYPPRIPQEVWIKDPRNRRWEALLPKPAPVVPPGPASSVNDFVEVLKATNEIRRDIREEMGPATPAAAPAVAAPAPADPWTAAEKILNMRSENPLTEFFKQQMADTSRSLEAERQRAHDAAEKARDREAALQLEIRKLSTPAAAAVAEKPKSLLEQLNELTSVTEALDKLKGGGGPGIVMPRKFGWVDGAKEILEVVGPFLQPIGDGLGHLLTARANAAQAPGQPQQARVQQQTASAANTTALEFVSKAMFTHFDNNDTGSEFAAWLYNGMPDEFDGFQAFKHPRLPNMQGAEAIVTAFGHSRYWDAIKPREPQFRAFVAEFCAWQKPGSEDSIIQDTEPEQQPEDVLDFDQEQM